MRKLMVSALVTASLLTGAGAALAAPHNASKDDNAKNDHGQCTAYFNGQKNGHPAQTDDQVEAMFDFCSGVVGGIGGNPDHGRFTCVDDPGTANTDEDNCAPQ
ncbi:MAG: hypothetical protein QOD30_2166 [Actinomycetota bacterium]|jgi:hypothetical protein|nr:hypothetical protein [Actinomycetota bacterium]